MKHNFSENSNVYKDNYKQMDHRSRRFLLMRARVSAGRESQAWEVCMLSLKYIEMRPDSRIYDTKTMLIQK